MRKRYRLTALSATIILSMTLIASPCQATEVNGMEKITAEDSVAETTDDSAIQTDKDITVVIEEDVPAKAEKDAAQEEQAMPMLLAGYTYSKTYTGLTASQVGGVSASQILEKAISVISANEGNYSSVNKNDNGALSLGYMQWHGDRALELMRLIISEDNGSAYSILGDSLYNEIISGNTSWASRTLNDSEAAAIKNLLDTQQSQTIQQKLANSDVSVYINHGIALGIKNGPALVYYADIENQCGYSSTAGSAACAKMAYNLTKDWSKVTLNELHLATVCFIYSGKNSYLAAASANQTAFLNRRCSTYGTAAGLGWAYCNSGDYLIPYSVSGTEGTKWLQNALNVYQNAGLAVDGSFGTLTKNALMAFQESQGIVKNGVASRVTVAALIRALYYNMATGASNITGNYTGLARDTSTGEWLYYKNGVFDSTMNSVIKNAKGWWYVKNGKVDFTYTGVAKNENGWWRIENGGVNFSFKGFAENSNGWWYLEGGKVQFGVNDVIKGTVNGTTGWWYVVDGKVTFTNTVAKNSNGWWYMKDGMVDFGHSGVEKNSKGWWRIEAGKVNFSFKGFAENSNGWWYLEGGKVQFGTNDVIKGTVNGTAGWWYVSGGKVTFTDTVAKNSNGWWYIKDGMVDFSHTGVEKNSKGWWRIEAGKVNFNFKGFAENSNGWWYLEGGRVQFGVNDVIRGTVKGTTGWWYVAGGKVDFSYTGIATTGDIEYDVVNGKAEKK